MKTPSIFALSLIIASAVPIPAAAPATVSKVLKESELTTITLTEQAEGRLDIKTVPLAQRSVKRTRLFPGELIIAQGEVQPGQAQPGSQAQSIFALLARMSPAELIRISEAQIKADGEIEAAVIRVEAAQQRLARAENLFRNKAGSARAVEEAEAERRLAQAAARQSEKLRQLLGASLLPTQNPERLWVRVPVYVGDAAKVSASEPAQVGDLNGKPGAPTLVARPMSTASSTSPDAASVHLFYELENKDRRLQLGQKVGVRLQLGGEAERLIAPWSGVVSDVYGGTWVYEQTEPHTFVRRRVQVMWVDGADAVLSTGPKPGAAIVAQGAAELFGTEVGFSK